MQRSMFALLSRILLALRSAFEARAAREAEILVLRQQLLVLSRRSRKRVRLRNIDRLILVWLSRLFPSVMDAIVIVKPETVLRWHRGGFRAYWRWKSWRRGTCRAPSQGWKTFLCNHAAGSPRSICSWCAPFRSRCSTAW